MEDSSEARPAAVLAVSTPVDCASWPVHLLVFRVVLLRALRFPPKNFLILFRKFLKIKI